jgi:hypothetical protein
MQWVSQEPIGTSTTVSALSSAAICRAGRGVMATCVACEGRFGSRSPDHRVFLCLFLGERDLSLEVFLHGPTSLLRAHDRLDRRRRGRGPGHTRARVLRAVGAEGIAGPAPWLFRIAYNRALDYLRRYERRMGEPLDVAVDIAADDGIEPENALARTEAVRAAISRFLELPRRSAAA